MKRITALFLTFIIGVLFLQCTAWGASIQPIAQENITYVHIKDVKQPHVSWDLTDAEKDEFLNLLGALDLAENIDLAEGAPLYLIDLSAEKGLISVTVYSSAVLEVKHPDGKATKYSVANMDNFVKKLNRLLTTQSKGYGIMCPSKTQLVQASPWAEPICRSAVDKGHIYGQIGYLTDSITREQFCDLVADLVKKHGHSYTPAEESVNFIDTGNENVTYLVERGIIKGKSDTEFAPNDFLTREEAAVILDRALFHVGSDWAITLDYIYFDDHSEISHWADNAIQIVLHLGIMNGVGDNKFAPKEIYTREQAIATLVRIYDKLDI